MSQPPHLIVVADKSLSRFGRKIVHTVSVKSDDRTKAAYWTPKHFTDTENRLTGRNRVVFLGDSAGWAGQ